MEADALRIAIVNDDSQRIHALELRIAALERVIEVLVRQQRFNDMLSDTERAQLRKWLER